MFDMHAKELSAGQQDDGQNEQTDDRFYESDSALAILSADYCWFRFASHTFFPYFLFARSPTREKSGQ